MRLSFSILTSWSMVTKLKVIDGISEASSKQGETFSKIDRIYESSMYINLTNNKLEFNVP